ncbi:MAG TPA: acetoacetate decarboxylase family protein [Candidatus Dormibacteraeota bacterium]|nr:acetoacetate decarboxylase family protein [Candidatus Dormibacteraeota bacterium]
MSEAPATPFATLATPRTRRGMSAAYGPVPWHMTGRALAIWFRSADPAEAARHIPDRCELDADPILRARFWDLRHDGGWGARAEDASGSPSLALREAVVAFPVSCAGLRADLPAHMYADEPTYVAFGREVMGWPLRGGAIDVDAEPAAGLSAGTRISGSLERAGRMIMRASLTLRGPQRVAADAPLPRWIGQRVIPDVDGQSADPPDLIETGPSRFRLGAVWTADATLEFAPGPFDELEFLRPAEIVRAEYWVGLDLTIGPGRILLPGSAR